MGLTPSNTIALAGLYSHPIRDSRKSPQYSIVSLPQTYLCLPCKLARIPSAVYYNTRHSLSLLTIDTQRVHLLGWRF